MLRIIFADGADREVIEALQENAHLSIETARALESQALQAAAFRCEMLVTRSWQSVDRGVLEAGRKGALRVVAQASAGLDNIDRSAAREMGLEILQIDPGNAVSVAELTIFSMIALLRNARAHWRRSEAGGWPEREKVPDRELRGRSVGLVGLGRVGTAVASRAAAFDLRLLGIDPYVDEEHFTRLGVVRHESLREMLSECDILSLHCPLTDETRGMIDASMLSRMPVGSFLINTARGPIVDSAALRNALDEGRLEGAAIDVYPREPPGRSEVVMHEKVLPTPHIAGHTRDSHHRRGVEMTQAILAWVERELQR